MKIIFVSLILVVVYHLFFYGLILKILTIFCKKENDNTTIVNGYSTITVLCPAYNEEEKIEEKIKSFLNLDYPKDKIEMIVISDDSTDKTNEIVERYTKENNIQLVIQKPRQGKQAAQNLIEPSLKSEIIISTDASSIFYKNSIKYLIRNFQNKKIGMVSGKMILIKDIEKESCESIYWKYETWLRKLESIFYSNIVASGCLFAIRRKLFTQIDIGSPDDFERALKVVEKGFIVFFEEKALIKEYVTEYNQDEIKRKIRMITQEWFVIRRYLRLLNPFRYPKIAFMLFSHKLIRWLLPVFSFLILFSNAFLLNNIFYMILFLFQIFGYFTGSMELILEKRGNSIKLFKLPAYFVAMNYSALVALFNFIRGKQFSTWNTVRTN